MADRARAFALFRHGDQRYGDLPYSAHLDDVAEIAVAAMSATGERRGVPLGEVRAVAYLHDVLEDTGTTIAELRQEFGDQVALAVDYLTDPEGPNRRIRKAIAHARLSQCPPDLWVTLVVKAADRLANLRASVRDGRDSLLKMYRKEAEDFRAAVFRQGLCDDLWEEMDSILASSGD